MGPALDAILARHDYPPPVSRLLAEAIVLSVLLGSSLKFDGKFILQTETDGPVDMLVVDFRTSGDIRAYARFDGARVDAAGGAADPATLLGKGVLAMTIDQGPHTSRYQGVVPLEGESLEDVAHTYFRQSEQIPTRVRLAVAEMQTPRGRRLPPPLARRRAARPVPPRRAGAHAPAPTFPAATPRRAPRSRRRRRTIPGSRRRRSSAPSRTTN